MRPVDEKYPKKIIGKSGGKLMIDDSSIGSNNGRLSKRDLMIEDLVM